jgi:uncharacterized SAM-binding protein YcdF (DUF218 family)
MGIDLFVNAFPHLFREYIIPLSIGIGVGLSLTRFRWVLQITSIMLASLYLIVGFTPLVPYLMRGFQRNDVLRPASAVVVLAAAGNRGKTLAPSTQERVLHGYEILAQGYAGRMVMTRLPKPDTPYIPIVSKQMRQLGLRFPIDEVGPVRDTHDEALAVSRLARQRGWSTVILVTQPTHMRRAAALFEKAGLNVIASPCAEGLFKFPNPETVGDRLRAFQTWLHEAIGFRVYQRRGWI